MTINDLINALNIPASTGVDQRVPKKLLVENGAPTASDKRQINEGIEDLRWIAALKPSNIGIPEYRDELREYLEIAVVGLTLRPSAKQRRIIELVHRAIPYPVVLITELSGVVTLSLAHIRWSQNENQSTVIDGDIISVNPYEFSTPENRTAFVQGLALVHQTRTNLHSLYQSWMDKIHALHAASITGNYNVSQTAAQASERADALRVINRLKVQINSIRAAAAKEKQMPKLVQLNFELKKLTMELADLHTRL